MKIAVCVPTHNENPLMLQRVMAQIYDAVGPDAHICSYNDYGSRGKGYALRQALKAAQVYKPDYYIFIDGDGDINPAQIQPFLFFLGQGYDVVVGKKELPGRLDRRVLTYLSRIWVKLLFGLGVDTQTGIKAFSYAPTWFLEGWAFDIEILWEAKKAGKKMLEIPIHAVVSSGKSWKDVFSAFRDTIKLRWGI